MLKITTVAIVIFILAPFFFPSASMAGMGVGITPGKIEVHAPFKPGGLYVLPPLTVINTGDEAGDYEVSIEYQSGQSKLSPARDWFIFTPSSFYLEPGQSQGIEIRANIPIKTVPDDYFAFLSAHPTLKVNTNGGANMQISAASKLYFTIAPANIFQAFYYRLIFLWAKYAPWTYIISIIILLSIVVVILRRFVTFNIGFGKKRKNKNGIVAPGDDDYTKISDNIDDILLAAMDKVEKYTAELTGSKFEEVFAEAKTKRQGISNFFYKNDSYVLSEVSLELKNILLLSRDGLEKVKRKDKDLYEKILDKVVSGIIG